MPTPRRPRVLLIGRRRDAITAARRIGWEPVTLDVAPRVEQANDAFGGFTGHALESAARLFPDRPPVAAVAVAAGAAQAAAAVRSLFGLPGISAGAALRCHDKLAMRRAATAAGIPCPKWLETTAHTTADELVATLGLPLVLKLPVSSGGRGVWVCHTRPQVAECLGAGLVAEEFTAGIEMSVETLLAGGRTRFQNHTRYLVPRWANVVPAGLEPPAATAVAALARRVHHAFRIDSGITHLELFLTPRGPVFGEIAARPPGGYIMELMARAYRFDPWEALLRISAGERPDLPTRARRHVGVWLLHPGEGEFVACHGLDRARAVRGIADAGCRLSPGDHTGRRVGSGEVKGRVLAETAGHASCCRALSRAARCVRFEMRRPSRPATAPC